MSLQRATPYRYQLETAQKAYNELMAILTAEKRPSVTLPFPFQRLPPEIRNAIYHLHLVQAKDLTRVFLWDDSLVARAQTAVHYRLENPNYMPPVFEYTALSILGVSRQLHEEALGIFYHHNTLQLQSVSEMRDFLSGIGPRRRAFIRDILFDYSGVGSPAAFKLLAGCENLTKLHIKVSCATLFRSQRRLNLLSAWGVRHLLKIRGLETVEISGRMPNSQMSEGFEQAVQNALLQPRKTVKEKKPAANRKQTSKGKNVAAGKKRTIEQGEAYGNKKTKLVHDETQIVNQSEGGGRDT